MSHPAPRHRKQSPPTDEYLTEQHRHRRQPGGRPSWMSGRLAAIAGAVTILGAAAAATAVYLPGNTGHPVASTTTIDGKPVVADGLGRTVANGVGLAIGAMPRATTSAKSTAGSHVSGNTHARKGKSAPRAAAVTKHSAAQPKTANTVYLNPLRSITGLLAERIDMGADYGGSGPIYALGRAVITGATTSAGWPGGGWISYRLTDGPARGLVVFVAEDVTPAVQVGQHVTSSTVICNMFNGSAGIETGWATSDSSTAESQMAAAGGIGGGGPFPTAVGMNFENLMVALGVPRSAFNGSAATFGVVPSGYPTSWSGLITKS